MQSLRLIKAIFGKVRVLRDQSSDVITIVERAEESASERAARATLKREKISLTIEQGDSTNLQSSSSLISDLTRESLDGRSRGEIQKLCKSYGQGLLGRQWSLLTDS